MFYLEANDNPVDARNAGSLNLARTAGVRKIAREELVKQPPADDDYTGPFSDFFKEEGTTRSPVRFDPFPIESRRPFYT